VLDVVDLAPLQRGEWGQLTPKPHRHPYPSQRGLATTRPAAPLARRAPRKHPLAQLALGTAAGVMTMYWAVREWHPKAQR